jgi:DNA-binding NtrC family response regulator
MSGTRILVVDDHTSALSYVTTVLRLDGFDVTETTMLRDALSMLDTRSYDAVVVDMYLGEGIGLSLLDHPSILHADSAVVVMSGTADAETATTAKRNGAHDFLKKPIGPEQLRRSVRAALQRRESRRHHVEEVL